MQTAQGFIASAVSAGIKKGGKLDLALIVSEVTATVAGVFTSNRVKAAPVLLDMDRVKSGRCRAIVVNSGNANCCTGAAGMENAIAMGRSVSDVLDIVPDHVLVSSTGVIGQPLPINRIQAAAPDLVSALSADGFESAAQAIMTTDTVPKLVTQKSAVDGKPYAITAMAKGAGMIRPDMATMLCFVCTDIEIDAIRLRHALTAANAHSFNRITIDGDTSTNDTVLVMANGLSGAAVSTERHLDQFAADLEGVLKTLARMIVKDGEGATKCVDIAVKNASSDIEARQMADTVANSNLVKTALFGEDANWGRIMAALGRAGVGFDPGRVDIYFGDVEMVQNGVACGPDAEAAASEVLRQSEFTITVDLKSGHGRSSVLTCDFSIDYVKINADYRT